MRRYGLYIFDLDGVLYFGETAVPGAAEVVRKLRQTAKIRFLTNNSTKTRGEFADKLSKLGFEATAADVATSASGTAKRLAGSRIYVVGEEGLRTELSSQGCIITGDSPEWVVVGACWSLTYAMIDEAQWLIRGGANYLATNLDTTFPIEDRVRPGAGSIVAAVTAACGKEPDAVIGKPQPHLVEGLMSDADVGPTDTLLIGDQLDTDILAAQNAGCDSALVASSVTRPEPTVLPTLTLPSLAELA